MPKLKVVIVQRVFSHYRKPVFDILDKRYDLYLLHSKNKSSIKQVSAPYAQFVPTLKYWTGETSVFFFIVSTLRRIRPDIIIHEGSPAIASILITILFSRLMGIKFVIWGHAVNNKDVHSKRLSLNSKIKIMYMKLSDAVLVYSKRGKKRLAEIIPPEKIFIARNTLNMEELLLLKKRFLQSGKANLKKKTGFTHRYNVIFLGRLLPEKQPGLLFDVFDAISESIKLQVAFHIVGGGELFDVLEQRSREEPYRGHFFLYGPIHDPAKSGELLFCSDIMIMPGYLGLSINHAFAFECPVMSFATSDNGPFHSPEVEYLVPGETGFLVKEHSATAMANQLVSFLRDEKLQEKMKSNINHCVNEICSLENMIRGFDQCIAYLHQ